MALELDVHGVGCYDWLARKESNGDILNRDLKCWFYGVENSISDVIRLHSGIVLWIESIWKADGIFDVGGVRSVYM